MDSQKLLIAMALGLVISCGPGQRSSGPLQKRDGTGVDGKVSPEVAAQVQNRPFKILSITSIATDRQVALKFKFDQQGNNSELGFNIGSNQVELVSGQNNGFFSGQGKAQCEGQDSSGLCNQIRFDVGVRGQQNLNIRTQNIRKTAIDETTSTNTMSGRIKIIRDLSVSGENQNQNSAEVGLADHITVLVAESAGKEETFETLVIRGGRGTSSLKEKISNDGRISVVLSGLGNIEVSGEPRKHSDGYIVPVMSNNSRVNLYIGTTSNGLDLDNRNDGISTGSIADQREDFFQHSDDRFEKVEEKEKPETKKEEETVDTEKLAREVLQKNGVETIDEDSDTFVGPPSRLKN